MDCSLNTAPVAAIPVNPFCWSKSAKHDVTLTSLTADLFYTRCGIVARRGMASFKGKFPVLQKLFAKNHRGALTPPPSEARDICPRMTLSLMLFNTHVPSSVIQTLPFSYQQTKYCRTSDTWINQISTELWRHESSAGVEQIKSHTPPAILHCT